MQIIMCFCNFKRETQRNNISTTHYRLTNRNLRKAGQLAIYKHDQRVEPGPTEKQLKLKSERDLNP